METPRKFIIAEFSIRKLGSSSVLIIMHWWRSELTDQKLCDNKLTWCFHIKLYFNLIFTMQSWNLYFSIFYNYITVYLRLSANDIANRNNERYNIGGSIIDNADDKVNRASLALVQLWRLLNWAWHHLPAMFVSTWRACDFCGQLWKPYLEVLVCISSLKFSNIIP